jgi:hypothetical protein
MSHHGSQREPELEEPHTAQGQVSVFGRRKLFAVVALTGIAAAGSFLGCGGETAGSSATANGKGVTGGIHSTSTDGSMSTAAVNTSKDVSCGADNSDIVYDYNLYIGFRCCSP